MKRVLWGLLVLTLLAAAAWAAFALPLGGRTLFERLRGTPAPQSSAATSAKNPTLPAAAAPAPSAPRDAAPQDSDRLTEQDRQQLDRLLEKRLQGPADGGKKDKP